MNTPIECQDKSKRFCDLCNSKDDVVKIECRYKENSPIISICEMCCLSALAMFDNGDCEDMRK